MLSEAWLQHCSPSFQHSCHTKLHSFLESVLRRQWTWCKGLGGLHACSTAFALDSRHVPAHRGDGHRDEVDRSHPLPGTVSLAQILLPTTLHSHRPLITAPNKVANNWQASCSAAIETVSAVLPPSHRSFRGHAGEAILAVQLAGGLGRCRVLLRPAGGPGHCSEVKPRLWMKRDFTVQGQGVWCSGRSPTLVSQLRSRPSIVAT